MAAAAILVVDDEEDILELVRYNLVKEGYQVQCVTSGEECLQCIARQKPDLIVLDLMLPGLSGLDVCRKLAAGRGASDPPIVMLSAKGEEADIIVGLELGADDYVTKPFVPKVLLARIRAVLRRKQVAAAAGASRITAGGLSMDLDRHEASLDGRMLELTATEFRLLHQLAANPGRVFTRNQLVVAVHGSNYPVTDRSIDVQIVGLRKKLEPYGAVLETVRGVGYRFQDKPA